jgi:hypothetical protein
MMRAPLCRDRILAAEPDLRDLLDALTDAYLRQPRGIAMASQLLCDGTGPLYNRRSPADLGVALRDATNNIRSISEAASLRRSAPE